MMSKGLIVIVTIIYGYVSLSAAYERNWPMVIVFFGYAFANVGMLLAFSK